MSNLVEFAEVTKSVDSEKVVSQKLCDEARSSFFDRNSTKPNVQTNEPGSSLAKLDTHRISASSLQHQAEVLVANAGSSSKKEQAAMTNEQRFFAWKLEDFVKKHFSAMDDNGDHVLSHAEVKLFAATRKGLSNDEKNMAEFLATNYDDLAKLTDASPDGFRYKRLNPKERPELTLGDLAMLRTTTSDFELQKAIQLKQAEGSIADYVISGTALGVLGATVGLLPCAFVPPRARIPILLASGAIGLLGGYRLINYSREQHYKPGCQDYYDQKKELARQILSRVKE